MFSRILNKLKRFFGNASSQRVIRLTCGLNLRVETLPGTAWPGESVPGAVVLRGRIIIPESAIQEIIHTK